MPEEGDTLFPVTELTEHLGWDLSGVSDAASPPMLFEHFLK